MQSLTLAKLGEHVATLGAATDRALAARVNATRDDRADAIGEATAKLAEKVALGEVADFGAGGVLRWLALAAEREIWHAARSAARGTPAGAAPTEPDLMAGEWRGEDSPLACAIATETLGEIAAALTARELRAVRAVAAGYSHREIASGGVESARSLRKQIGRARHTLGELDR